jgi:hypothetical protein
MLIMYAQAHVVIKQSWTTPHTLFIYIFLCRRSPPYLGIVF